MKKLYKNPAYWYAVILVIGIVACQKNDATYDQPPVQTTPSVAAFYTAFADSLEKELDKSQFGYSISIYSGSKLILNRSAGNRSKSVDAEGLQPFTDTTRIHVASISKTITAMAALKMLQEKNISLSEFVYKYLPVQWSFSDGFKTITFRELLTHTSGIRNADGSCNNADVNTYTSLKTIAGNDINSSKVYCYQNANFGLLRIILPVIRGFVASGTTTDDINTQKAYEAIIQEYVFQKAGVKTAYCEWRTGNALLFDFPYTGKAAFNSGNLLGRAGGLGWYLSAQEVGKVMSHLSDAGQQSILPNNWKDSLLNNGYGCFRTNTTKGAAFWHDGLWYRTQGTEVQGMRGVWMKFPTENMTVVLLVNALRGPANSPGFPVANTGIVPYVVNTYNKTVK